MGSDRPRADNYASPRRQARRFEVVWQYLRANWLSNRKALKQQKAFSKVFAVGDDWQPSYRFAGSDITLNSRPISG